ncbi:MAG: YggS family pyridoxal phosphate-dependent enzyme [Syntrophorhabdus sp.]|jgi:pyridoxal phosphate enzyme (YggS family)|nr:YggS family pyridoxal phosphate-dependent enzyme [Syntrophorhabdus sp.]
MSDIRQAIEAVRERIDRACGIAGRDPAGVTLVAVTKTVDAARVVEAIEAGLGDIGENYVQEAKGKIEAIGPGRARWHMIGHIQSNKVKYIPSLFDCVHTVDSIAIMEGLEKRGKEMDILFEVNLAGEATKSGTDMEGLRRILERALSLAHLKPVGLMTMPPYVEDPEEVRGMFRQLRTTLETMNAEFGLAMRELSMGMSSDLEVAVEEGATMVRIGTALFGERR